jgi:hypothetical protein
LPTLRELCRDSLGDYYLALNPSYGYVEFQQERIVPVLEGVEAGDIDRLMIFMPAGHAKTDIATKAFIPWYLGRNPTENAILLCHTMPLAKDYGSHIRRVIADNEIHRQIFPEVKISSTNHANDFFMLNRGGAFYAFGMEGGITGRRANLLLIDDPIKSLEDALSDLAQTNLYNTYKAVVKDRLRPHGKIVLVVTRWATRDLAARILADEGEDWKVLVLKAQEDEPNGPYLWEDYYGKKRYQDAKKDAFIWNAKWQQMPEPRLIQGFSPEWLHFYAPQDLEKIMRYNSYIFVDPAMGKTAAHDRTAMLVVIAGPEKKTFLVDAVLDRIDPSERIEHLVRLTRIWKPKAVYYEEYALTTDTHFLRKRFDEEGLTDTPVVSLGREGIKGMNGGRMKKDDRIYSWLAPDFRDGLIWLPKRMIKKLADGQEFDIIEYLINHEYLPYAGEGSIENDDMLDCLSRIHDPSVMLEFAQMNRQVENYENYPSGGSWESDYAWQPPSTCDSGIELRKQSGRCWLRKARQRFARIAR